MKKLPKILTIIFFSLFILQMVGLVVFITIPQKTQAADDPIFFTPQISIGNDFQAGDSKEIKGDSIGKYIMAIYKYAIGIVGILATVVLMYGGIRWLTSGGSSDRIGDAKSWIGAALSGLVLALASFLILNTINPELVKIQNINPQTVKAPEKTGCCKYDGKARNKTKEDCDKETGSSFNASLVAEYNRCTEPDEGGCCARKSQAVNTNYSDCTWKDSRTNCPKTMLQKYYKGTQCNTITKCPQHSSNCETENNYCTSDRCCEGLICCEKPGWNLTSDTCLQSCPAGWTEKTY